MEGMDWLDQRKCATCGRKFTVLRPQMWAYKRGTPAHMKYYCSWSCLRKSEGKDETEMGEKRVQRDRREIAETIIRMAKEGQGGGPVLNYLEGLGYKNQVQAVHDIKAWCKEKAPDLYDQWPVRVKGRITTQGQVEVADRLPDVVMKAEDVKLVPEKEWTPAEEVYPKEGERITTDKPSFVELEKTKAEKILGQEPLEVANVFSRVMKGAEYRKEPGGRMTMIMPPLAVTNNLRMTAYEWFKFSEEILVAIRQLDMANPSRALEPEEYTGNNAPLKG